MSNKTQQAEIQANEKHPAQREPVREAAPYNTQWRAGSLMVHLWAAAADRQPGRPSHLLHAGVLPAIQRQALAAQLSKARGNRNLQLALGLDPASRAVQRVGEDTEATGGGEQPRLCIGLVDQNPEHMRNPGELATFLNAAQGWAGDAGGMLFEVTENSEVQSTLASIVAAHPDSVIETLALFGHGSSSSGWVHMGDVGPVLLQPEIISHLAPNLRIILYMCLTGAEPGSQIESRTPGGEAAPGETGEEAGGTGSYAARLAAALSAQLPDVQVWGHTTRAHTTENPNWRVFGGPPGEETTAAGQPYFRYVFDDPFVDDLMRYLNQYRQRAQDCPQPRLRNHVRRNREQVLAWLYLDYINLAGGPTHGTERARWAPMDPEAVAQEIRQAWLERYGLDEATLRATPEAEAAPAAEGQPVQPEQAVPVGR